MTEVFDDYMNPICYVCGAKVGEGDEILLNPVDDYWYCESDFPTDDYSELAEDSGLAVE